MHHKSMVSANRVGKVLNAVAGFRQDSRAAARVSNLTGIRYVIGNDSAGLTETRWSRIADLLVDGEVPPDKSHL
jgi:hypothetical protein